MRMRRADARAFEPAQVGHHNGRALDAFERQPRGPRGHIDVARADDHALAGIVDLTLATQQVIGRTYDPLPMYLLAAAMYFAINYALSVASRRLEARFAYIRE